MANSAENHVVQKIVGRKNDLRLVPVAGAVWLGTLSGLLLAGLTNWAIVAGAFVVAGLSGFLTLRRRRLAKHSQREPRQLAKQTSVVAAVAVAVILGATVGMSALQRQNRDPVMLKAAVGVPVRVQVMVITDPSPLGGGGKDNFYAKCRVQKVKEGDLWLSSAVEIVLTGGNVSQLRRGDRLIIYGKIATDFWAQGRVVGGMEAPYLNVIEPATGWQAQVNRLKEALAAATLGQPNHVRALVPGMAVGDDRLMAADFAQAMKVTSLTHLTAVSGSHIAVVLAILTVLIPGVRWARPAAVVLFLVVLVTVVGPEPSVLRAAWSGMVGVWGVLTRRGGQPQATLAAIVIVSLLIEPWMAISFGFALSVLATWGLLFSGRVWLRVWGDWWQGLGFSPLVSRPGKILIEMAAISCAAQLWVMPVLLLLNPWIPGWGVVANVLAGPAVAPITILGLAAAVVVLWMPSVAVVLCQLATPFTAWIQGVATFCAGQPGAQVPWISGPVGVAMAILLIGLVVMFSSPKGSALLRASLLAGKRKVLIRK